MQLIEFFQALRARAALATPAQRKKLAFIAGAFSLYMCLVAAHLLFTVGLRGTVFGLVACGGVLLWFHRRAGQLAAAPSKKSWLKRLLKR